MPGVINPPQKPYLYPKKQREMAKLSLDDFYDDAFLLLALHTRAEDYTLAYALNKTLGLQLQKRRHELDIVQGQKNASFPIFDYETKENVGYFLVRNHCVLEEKKQAIAAGLFENTQQTTVYLLPEWRTVDYFLKVEPEITGAALATLLKHVKAIPFVQTAYEVRHDSIKTTHHLNFDPCRNEKKPK